MGSSLLLTLINFEQGSTVDLTPFSFDPIFFPEFATFLVECGIDSMSLIPDTVIKTRLAVAAKEKELGIKAD